MSNEKLIHEALGELREAVGGAFLYWPAEQIESALRPWSWSQPKEKGLCAPRGGFAS